MGFWADKTIEPKRQHNWIMTITGEGQQGQTNQGTIESWVVKSVEKPKIEISEAEHRFINHTFYYPGRLTYGEITLTLVDPVDPDTSSLLMEKIVGSGYKFPDTAQEAQSSITKSLATSQLGDVKIEQLRTASVDDPQGPEVIERWLLFNAWIKSVEFGSLSYDEDGLVEITVTMRYDYAKINPPELG